MKRVALGKVAKIDRTMATDQDCDRLPYVGLEHIEKEAGHFAAEFPCQPASLRATKFRFTPKHVLYGKLRPYLNKVALSGFDGVCTTEILPILPAENKLDRTYLWAFLLTPEFVEWASTNVSGANLPRLSPKLLASYEIPLPPLAEQKRIAGLLARADRVRRLRRTVRAMGEGVLQSVFLEMFGDPVENPRGWPVVELRSQIERIDSGWSPVCGEARTSNEQWGILRLGAVTTGAYLPAENKQLLPDTNPRPELEVKKRDVLITRKNTADLVAACAFVHRTPPRLMLPDTIFRFVLAENGRVQPEYLWGLFSEASFRKRVQSLATGTAGSMPNISKTKFLGTTMILPPPTLQKQFAEVVHKYERVRAQQREAERQAEHLFQALLHRAFRREGGGGEALRG